MLSGSFIDANGVLGSRRRNAKVAIVFFLFHSELSSFQTVITLEQLGRKEALHLLKKTKKAAEQEESVGGRLMEKSETQIDLFLAIQVP